MFKYEIIWEEVSNPNDWPQTISFIVLANLHLKLRFSINNPVLLCVRFVYSLFFVFTKKNRDRLSIDMFWSTGATLWTIHLLIFVISQCRWEFWFSKSIKIQNKIILFFLQHCLRKQRFWTLRTQKIHQPHFKYFSRIPLLAFPDVTYILTQAIWITFCSFSIYGAIMDYFINTACLYLRQLCRQFH